MKAVEKNEKSAALRGTAVLIISLFSGAVSGMLFILITSSKVAAVISALCSAVLCLLPAFCTKTTAYFLSLRPPRLLASLSIIGLVLSSWSTMCYYVSHGYELSVYRYMKNTAADDYYFGGYEEYKNDYSGAEDFMRQMKAAPASIVIEGMSEEKLSRLTADELAGINSESLWDYCGFNDILGENAEETEASMKKASTMNAYDFTFKYRSLRPKTLGYMLTHPILAAEEITLSAKNSPLPLHFLLLLAFIFAQLIIVRAVSLKFFINEKKELVFIRKGR